MSPLTIWLEHMGVQIHLASCPTCIRRMLIRALGGAGKLLNIGCVSVNEVYVPWVSPTNILPTFLGGSCEDTVVSDRIHRHISRICLIVGGKQLQMAVISSLCTTLGRGITNK